MERILENFAYGFSCTIMPTSIELNAGDNVEVFWNESKIDKRKDTLFCGYIYQVSLHVSSKHYRVTFNARSYALDLIDSVDSQEATDGDLSTVTEKVCRAYSVPFSNTAGRRFWRGSFCLRERVALSYFKRFG